MRRWYFLGVFLVSGIVAAVACGDEVADVPPIAPEGDSTAPAPTTTVEPEGSTEVDAGSSAPDAAAEGAADAADAGIDGARSPIVFSVMGDIPYAVAEDAILQAQIAEHNAKSPSKFMLHLGDIKSGTDPCLEPQYMKVAGFLHALKVPTFIIPADNEWNDCVDPNPTQAWGFWTKHFGHFEAYWPAAPKVARQAVRDENFAWVDSGVIFVGINLPGGLVHSATEWATRLPQNAQWIADQIALHGASSYALVLFAHADPTATHDAFMNPYRATVKAWGKPVLHVMGDLHTFKLDRPFPEKNILRVEVEEGAVEKPIQVTVTPPTGDAGADAGPDAGNPPFTIKRNPY